MKISQHFRHVLLWLFDKNNAITTREASDEINGVYGQGSISQPTASRWFKKFRDGDKGMDDLEYKSRSGRPSTLNDEELRLLVEMDPKATVRELAEVLQKSVSTVWQHLQDMGFVSKLGKWVPHRLSDLNKAARFVAASGLLGRSC